MKLLTFFALLAVCLSARSAAADEIDDFMQSNKRYAAGAALGVGVTVLENLVLSKMERNVTFSVLQNHHPKLYKKFLDANTAYHEDPSNPAIRASYQRLHKAVKKAMERTRKGTFRRGITVYERSTLKNLNRLKLGARIWGSSALGVIVYIGYDSVSAMIQNNKETKQLELPVEHSEPGKMTQSAQ